MRYDDYEDYDDEEESVLLRNWKLILAVITVPILYLFIYLPLKGLPEYVQFDELIKFSTLSEEHERLILIGDVHGCFDELTELLEKAEYTSNDRVILLGDFISKGPNSLKVLDFAIENNFSAVLGNHELNILSKYQNSKPVTFDDGEKYSLTKPGDIKSDLETRLARHLLPKHVEYLSRLPLVLDIGQVEKGKGLALHVGLTLEQPFTNQNINEQLEMDRDWYKSFNSEMPNRAKGDRLVVFYGHNSKYGLNLKKYTKGLDSACVSGGQLTAMILNNDGSEQGLVQVNCQEYV